MLVKLLVCMEKMVVDQTINCSNVITILQNCRNKINLKTDYCPAKVGAKVGAKLCFDYSDK